MEEGTENQNEFGIGIKKFGRIELVHQAHLIREWNFLVLLRSLNPNVRLARLACVSCARLVA